MLRASIRNGIKTVCLIRVLKIRHLRAKFHQKKFLFFRTYML
jgi:hypothetical protein